MVLASLTTLTWEHVRNAGTFCDAINAFNKDINEFILSKGLDFTFIALSSWDLRVQLPREARDKGVILPAFLQHPKVFDLRTEYTRWQAHHPETLHCSPHSLSGICTALEVADFQHDDRNGSFQYQHMPPTLRPRRALEEAILVKNILFSLTNKCQPFGSHSDVLTKPMDVEADVRAFLNEQSKVLYLSNLPHDTTQSELESWFTQYGGRPIAFWTFRTPDQSHPNESGFAVFATHEEAAESLSMNGRALNDRAISVSPSGNAVLERARSILTTFPPSKNRPRPGDWNCPSCGFSNFQRRTACFRCSYPANSNVSSGESGHRYAYNHGYQIQDNYNTTGYGNNTNNSNNGHRSNRSTGSSSVPFRAGDWKCSKEGCNYHNFAKNVTCLRCGASRSTAAVVAEPNNNHHNNRHHFQYQPSQHGTRQFSVPAAIQQQMLYRNSQKQYYNQQPYPSYQQTTPEHKRQVSESGYPSMYNNHNYLNLVSEQK